MMITRAMRSTRRTVGLAVLVVTAGATVAAAPGLVVPAASAEPAPVRYRLNTVEAGVAEGAELAVDAGRRLVFVADGDDYNHKDDTTGQVVPYPHRLAPRVAVVGADSLRVTRVIDYAGLPSSRTKMGPVQVPMPQVPVGLAVDTELGVVLTTSARGNGAAVVPMSARRAVPADMVRSSIPFSHVMGVAADSSTGRAYIANNGANAVIVIDTATRREVAVVKDVFSPTLLSVDPARHRVYVGNADTKAKRTNHVTVIDTRTNTVIKKIATPFNSRPAVDAATGLVYAASFGTGEIAVIDPNSLTVVRRIQTGTTPVNVAIDSRKGLAYTANLFKRTISVIDLRSNRVVATVPTGQRPHTVVVDEKTGTVFATGFQSTKLTVLRVARTTA